MTTFHTHKLVILWLLTTLLCLSGNLYGSDSYEDRKNAFLETILQTADGPDILVLQAYFDLPIDEEVLANALQTVQNSDVADFTITSLIRFLYLMNGEYDEQVLEVFNEQPFWLPDNTPENRVYWTENHMVMWLSAAWLLHEKYDREIMPTTRQMLVKWLDVKIEYGFYEYFSPVYYPFTAAAMLNMMDFAEDEEIREKAELAFIRMFTDVMFMVNDVGAFFPTCGRGEVRKYFNAYEQGIATMIHLITGLGDRSDFSQIGSTSLATSGFDPSEISDTWTPESNTTIHYGHKLSEMRNIYSELSKEDRIIFQWSAGGFIHPLVIGESFWATSFYDLWSHEEFSQFAFAQFLTQPMANLFGHVAASITRSWYFGNAEIDIYKNDGVVLTSSQDLWKGRAGYQYYPVVATVETTPVYTRSGEVTGDWSNVPNKRQNDHLPYVDQNGNVALIMYRPKWDLPFWGYKDLDVALRFDFEDFDETRAIDNWQLGRIDDSYVAVGKHCEGIINGIPACDDKDGQTWAIIVGNQDEHESFDEFEAMIGDAIFEERWYFNWQKFEWIYYGHIQADGKDIDYHWGGPLIDAPSDPGNLMDPITLRLAQQESDLVHVYPNPAKTKFKLNLGAYKSEIASISIINVIGQQIYKWDINEDTKAGVSIDVSNWAAGTYTIVIKNADGTSNVKRLLIQ